MDWIENSIKNAQQGKTKTVGDDWISNSIRQATARNTGNNFQKRLNDVYALGNTLDSNIEKHESGWASLGNSALLISDIQKYFSEAESLKNDLIANSDAYKQAIGEDNYKKIQTQIDNILNTKEGTVSSHKKRAQLYGQYDTAEDYNNAKRNYQLDTKYSRLKTFEDYDKYIKSGNFEQADMPQDEKDYLLRLGYSLEYREAVSSLNAAKKRLEGLPKKITVNSPYNEQQRVKIQQEKKNLEATIKNLETRIKEMDNMGGIYTGLNTTVLSESGEYAFDERWSNKKAEMEEKTALNDKEKLKLLSGQKVDKSDYWVDEIFKNAQPYQYLYYATEDEKKLHAYIKKHDGEGAAKKYLDDLKIAKLDKRLNQARMKEAYDFASKSEIPSILLPTMFGLVGGATALKSSQKTGNAELASLASIPANLLSGLEFGAYRMAGLDGVRSTLATQSQGFREGTKTHWDGAWGEDVWDFLYDTGMSGVDSAAAAGLGAVVPYLGEVLLGGSAAASTYNDALDRGISHGDAMLTALTAGVAESLFEHMSISKFLDAGDITKGFTKSGLRQATKTLLTEMGINFTEELFTEVSNIITDTAINGNLSNYAIAVKDYYMQGMSPEEAKEKALGDFKNQILEAGLSGALMGFGFGSISSIKGMARSQVLNSQKGGLVKLSGNVAELKTVAELSNNEEIKAAAEKLTETSKPSEIGYVYNSLVADAVEQSVKEMTPVLLENGAKESGSNSAKGWATQIASSVFEANQGKIAALQTNAVTSAVYNEFVKEGKYGGDTVLALADLAKNTQPKAITSADVVDEQNATTPITEDGTPAMGPVTSGESGATHPVTEAFGKSVKENLEKDRPNKKVIIEKLKERMPQKSRITPEGESIIKNFAKARGLKVIFTDNLVDDVGNGKYNSDTKTLYISRYSINPIKIVIKHEFTHSVETSKFFDKFKDYCFTESEVFKDWLKEKGFDKYSQAVNYELEKYNTFAPNTKDKSLKAENEVIANFVSETLFNKDGTDFNDEITTDFLKELSKNNRNLFQRFVDFVKNFIKRTFTGNSQKREINKLEQKFIRLVETVDTAETKNDTAEQGETEQGQYSLAENKKITHNMNEQKGLNKRFEKELEDWFDKTTAEERKKSGKRFLVGTTTDVLKNIGIKDYNIYFGASKINKILTDNKSMTLDIIKQAVKLLEDPIIIMQSQTVEDSIVIFGEVYAENKPVMISVLLNPKTKNGEILNYAVITSAYGRRSGNLQNLINKSTIYYINEQKNRTDTWLKALGLQLPSAITKYGPINSIPNSAENVKQKQLDVINKSNPAPNSYQTWVRSVDDIKTLAETLEDSDWQDETINPDLTRTDIENAIAKGKITVYSSYPISQGVFVSPSRMEAESYSGNGKVYEKTVDIQDVAWIDPTQGQYAKVEKGQYSLPDLDTNYLKAVESGDMETAQRMVDEAAKKAGYDVRAYHGTGADFNIFSEENIGKRNVWGKGFYFGTSKGIADDYASLRAKQGGKYRIVNAYLKMDNPYTPHKSDLGTAEEILNKWFPDMWKNSKELGIGYIQGKLDNSPLDLLQFIAEHNNVEVQDVLKKYGYDSVKDGGEIVVFDSNQIKSADPVTYDDKGNVIPLSERFKNDNNDIRYSLPDIDSSGHKLSKGQMEYFKDSKIRDEKGRLLRLFHGTQNGGFTKFLRRFSDDKLTFFLTPSKNVAETYSGSFDKVELPEGRSRSKGNGQAGLYEVFANAKNPLVIEGNGHGWDNIPFTFETKTKKPISLESEYDAKTGTLSGEYVYEGKTHKINFNFSHLKEKARENAKATIEKYNLESTALESEYYLELSKLAKAEIREHFEKFMYKDVARSLAVYYSSSIVNAFNNDGKKHRQYRYIDVKNKSLDSVTTRDVTEWAKQNGYDAVWFKNIMDVSDKSSVNDDYQWGDVLAVFDSNQIKDVDNTEPTKNKDIRYSLPDIPDIAKGKSYDELISLVDEGKITSDEALAALGKEHGTMPKGENPKVDVYVPEKISETKNVNQFMRNVLESGHLDADMTETEKRNIINGARTYRVISDKEATNRAQSKIKTDVNGAVQQWESVINGGGRITKFDIALGEQLLIQAAESGNANDVTKYVAELADLGTQLGQDVQALRLLKQMTGLGQLYYVTRAVAKLNKDIEAKFGEKHKIVEIDPDLAQILANSKSQKEIDNAVERLIKDVASQVKSSWVDKFNSWRYLAMLGNPRTHARNLAGNGVFLPAIGTKNKIAAVLENVFVEKEKRTKVLGLLNPEYKDFATQDYANVEDIIKSGGKMNPSDKIREQMKVFNTKALEKARKFNFDMLEKEDGWFLKWYYVRALGAAMQARGLDVNNISPTELEELRSYAINEAQKATYRDASHFANTLNKLSRLNKDANIISKAMGVAVEGLLPFKKTPINILKRGIEYSPIGIATSIIEAVRDLRKGEFSGAQFIDSLSAGLTGTGIMLLGAFAYSLGIISGGMDYEDDDALERMAGYQPFAINIGDYSYTIDFAAPAVMPFMIGAETAKMFNNESVNETLGFFDTIAAIGAPMTELSMLQGLNDAIETIAYSDNKMGDFATNIFASYFSQYVPTLGGQIARTFDSTRRTNFVDKNSSIPKILQTSYQKALGKIPYFENKKVPYVDAWGRTEENDNILLRAFENFVSPGYVSKIEDDKVNKELARIYTQTSEGGVIPKRASTSFEVGGKTVNLNADEYVQYATDKGQYSRQYLEELMSSSMYSTLDDSEKASVVSDLYSYANAKAKTNVSDYDYRTNNTYKTAAKLEEAGISPVSYYIARAATSVENADTDGSNSVSKSEKKKALRNAGFSYSEINTILNVNKK